MVNDDTINAQLFYGTCIGEYKAVYPTRSPKNIKLWSDLNSIGF